VNVGRTLFTDEKQRGRLGICVCVCVFTCRSRRFRSCSHDRNALLFSLTHL